MNTSLTRFASQLQYLFTHLTAANLVDIALVGAVFFVLLQVLHRTRTSQLLRGIIIFAVLALALLTLLPLTTFNWLLRGLLLAGVVALPLLFQDELRRALLELGQVGRRRVGRGTAHDRISAAILRAVTQLATRREGALIVLEGRTPLSETVATGIPIQADSVSAELLLTIFHPKTPLHDGAVILSGDRLAAAGCILPLHADHTGDIHLGTRHRAALGLSVQVPDALTVVVSEETGRIAVAQSGQLHRARSIDELERWLDGFHGRLAGERRPAWRWLTGTGSVVILRNLVLALALATVAWVAVTYQVDPPQTAFIGGVTLGVIPPQDDLIRTSELPRTISVEVQTTREYRNNLRASSVVAKLDLSRLSDGVQRVPVQVTIADENAQIVSVLPSFVDVTLEPLLSRSLAPTVVIPDVDALPLGYVVGELAFSPSTVTIRGPQSLVEQVTQARAQLSVAGRRAEFQQSLSPALLNDKGEVVATLQPEPERVVVTVPIRRSFYTRGIAIQAALTDTLPPNYEITRVRLTPAFVTLAGDRSAIEAVGDFLTTAPLDLTDVRSELTVDAPLILPEGVTALDAAGEVISSVVAHVAVEPVTDYLVRSITPSVTGVSDSQSVQLTPTRITVLLIGPQPLLDQVRNEPALLAASLDLTNRRAGVYNLPVAVQAPAGLQVEIFPAEVRVNLLD